MPTREQLYAALQRADQAGDTNAARAIAGRLSSGQFDQPQQAAPEPAQQEPAYSASEGMGVGEKLAVGAGRGAMDAYQGMAQLGLGQLTGDGPMASNPFAMAARLGLRLRGVSPEQMQQVSDQYTADKTDELALYERNNPGGAATVGRIAGNVAATPLPGIGMGGGLAARLGGAAAGGAAQGAMQFVPEGGSRTQNTLLGGAAGAIGQGLIGEPLQALAGKIGSLFGKSTPNLTPEAQAALDFATKNQLPIGYDDLSRSEVAKMLGTAADEVPVVGSGATRKAQAQQAEAAARDVVSQFATGNQGRTADVLRDSAEAQLGRARKIKNNLYTEAFTALNQAGPVATPRMRTEAARLIKEEMARGSLADKGLIAELTKLKEAPRDMNFEALHRERAALGSTIRAGMTGDAAVLGDYATARLSKVKGALDKDLSLAAQQVGGNASALWKRADKFYRDVMPRYKKGVVATMLRSNNPDAIAERILGATDNVAGSDREGVAREVYKALDKTGRAEVRSALLEKALANSMSPERPFSPAQFAQNLDKIGARVGVFFRPQEKRMLDGLGNYMAHIKRAGQYMENPPTGRRLAPILMGGAAIIEPSALAGLATSAFGVRTLFRTNKGRDLLLKLGGTSPGSQAAQHYAGVLNKWLARTAAANQTQPDVQQQPEARTATGR